MAQSSAAIMEVGTVAKTATHDPDYIFYLLDPKQEYTCYFVVGNPDVQNTEKIGVVKKMLLAHSIVLRAELQDSKMKEKNDVHVTDIFPDTFRNLLRYIYGYDNTASLSFDEADNLLYAAEKYMLSNLKNKLATHLMSMLDYSNICGLMNNPACYTVLELNTAITEILQCETDKVLASPQLLGLCPDAFLKILEQEVSSVAEIDLWRAALKWAKNRVSSEDGQTLRNELSNHLKHLRICSMSNEDICKEIVPTKILSYDELILVSQAPKNRELQTNLTTICNTIKERDRPFVVNPDVLGLNFAYSEFGKAIQSVINLQTLVDGIELCSVQLYKSDSVHQCSCSIIIEKGKEAIYNIVIFDGQLGTNSVVPMCCNGKNVQLSPNCLYTIRTIFSCTSIIHSTMYNSSRICGNHFFVEFQKHSSGYHISHYKSISYKTITKRVKRVPNV